MELATIAVAKGYPFTFNDRIQNLVYQLVARKANRILLGRVLFDYNNPNESVPIIQHEVVTLPNPLQKMRPIS